MPCSVLPGATLTDSFDAPSAGGPGGRHRAIDLMGAAGSVVYAYSDGVIGNKFSSGVQPGMLGVRVEGNDGNHYFYNHLDPTHMLVQAGQFVTAGTPIGVIGDPSKYGYSFPSHVHFSINEGRAGTADPYPLLKAAATCGGGQGADQLMHEADMLGQPIKPIESTDPQAASTSEFNANKGNVRDRFYQTGQNVRNFLTQTDQSSQNELPQITPQEQRKTPLQQLQDLQPQQQQQGAQQPQQQTPSNQNAMTYGGWASMFLQRLGATDNASTRSLLIAWMRREGTAAQWNPLATTQGGYGGQGFNSVGVKNYPDVMAGIDANIRALTNGRYPTILQGLRSGDANLALSNQNEWRTWGSGDIRSLYVDVSGNLNQWDSYIGRYVPAGG